MITKIKLEIFQKYLGDIDAFARMGTTQEKQIIKDSDWSFIDNVINDIKLENAGLLSAEMKNKVKEKINNNIDDLETKNILYMIVKEWRY